MRFLLPLLLLSFGTLLLGAEESGDALRRAAQAGDAHAMVRLGDAFFKGEGRPRNLELAAFWYRKAALEKKLPLGLYRYGVCREFGWGTDRDPREACALYEQSDRFGPARLRLAKLLLKGVPGNKQLPPLPPDKARAVEMLRALCKDHYYPALFELAKILYADPLFRKSHAAEIYSLILQASNTEQVSPEVLIFHARLLQDGVGTRPDPVYARVLLELAAKQKDPEGMFRFAEILESGRGTPVRPEKAFALYKEAAGKKHPGAVTRMGDYLLEGKFVPQDPAAAREHFRQAAEKGYPPALRKLGWCFENGIGGPKELREAFNFYERSAHLGDPRGNFHAGRCFLSGIGVKADPAGAVFFFRRGAAQGDREAMLALADCLETGRGCARDPELARKARAAAERL